MIPQSRSLGKFAAREPPRAEAAMRVGPMCRNRTLYETTVAAGIRLWLLSNALRVAKSDHVKLLSTPSPQ